MATSSPAEHPGALDPDGRTIRLDAALDQPAGRVVVVVRPQNARGQLDPLPPELAGPDGQPNTRYRTYLRYQQVHAKAREAYTAAHAAAFTDPQTAARWPIDGVVLQAAVDHALSEWMTLGHKAEVESVLPPPD